MSALSSSIERDGLLHPLVACMQGEKMVLLDGFKRFEVLKKLKVEKVEVRLVDLSEAQAKAAMLVFNRPDRGLSEIEEAWVLRSLVRDHKLKQVEVGELLGRHSSWVCRRLRLVERLVEVLQEEIRLGLLSPTAARELVKLPRGKQIPAARAIREHRLSTRQVVRLVELLLAADEHQAEELLCDPLPRLLQEDSGGRPDPRLSAQGRAVKKAIDRFEGSASWLQQKLSQALPAGLVDGDHAVLKEPVSASMKSGRRVLSKLKALEEICGGPDDAPSP